MIGCDGIHSPVREALEFKYEGSEYDGLVMQMIDVQLGNFFGTDHLLHYHISKDTFLMIGKLSGPNHRVLVSAQGDVSEIEQQDLISPIVRLHLLDVEIGEPDWKTTWEIWIRKADTYRQGHVFLCGESAHVHSVAGGLEERMALTQTDGWQDDAVARISGLSYNYRDLIEVPDGTRSDYEPAIGDRLPDTEISPHLRLHQLIAHTRYTLLIVLPVCSDEALGSATEVAVALSARYPWSVRVELIAPDIPHPWSGILPIADPHGRVASLLNTSSAGEFVLIRPDGYIGYRCPLEDGARLEAFLATYLISQR